jgi:thioredoxin-dependent peroxiredoxin
MAKRPASNRKAPARKVSTKSNSPRGKIKEKIMLKEGDQAPDFRLKADDGNEISLSELRGKPVVLYFYPRANTPGCTIEANEFRELKSKFDKSDVVVLGCSSDKVESQAKFKAKYKLNFPLLSDPEFDAIEAYDARRMKSFLGKSFLGIVRSTFLIGPDGRIAKVWDKVKAKGHASEVLDAAEQLRGNARGAAGPV